MKVEPGHLGEKPRPHDHPVNPPVEQELEDRQRDQRVPVAGVAEPLRGARRVPCATALEGSREHPEGADVGGREHDQLGHPRVAKADGVGDDRDVA